MAITTKRVYLSHDVNDQYAPVGHAQPTTPSAIGTVDVRRKSQVFAVVASASVNVNKVTAFDDLIGTELVTLIDAYIAAVAPGLGIDTTTHTVQYNARVESVIRGVNGLPNDELLPAANDSFLIACDLQVANC